MFRFKVQSSSSYSYVSLDLHAEVHIVSMLRYTLYPCWNHNKYLNRSFNMVEQNCDDDKNGTTATAHFCA